MRLALYHEGGELLLPRGVRLSLPGLEFEKRAVKRYARDGANIRGDRTAGAPKLSLDYEIAAPGDQEFLNEWARIVRFLRGESCKNCYLRITPETGAPEGATEYPVMRFRVDMDKSGAGNESGLELRIHSRKISLFAEDADPEDDASAAVTEQLSNEESLLVANTGDGRCFPIITIKAIDDLFEFALQNVTTGLSFTITDQSFTEDRSYVLDFNTGEFRLFEFGATEGTVRRNTLTGGGPWYLVPGENEIEFFALAGRAEVTIAYRRVWFLG